MQELVFPLKEPLQTSGTQSLKLDLYRNNITMRKKWEIKRNENVSYCLTYSTYYEFNYTLCLYRFVGTLDIPFGLLANGRYQSPPLSLKNKEGESLQVIHLFCLHNGIGIQFGAGRADNSILLYTPEQLFPHHPLIIYVHVNAILL